MQYLDKEGLEYYNKKIQAKLDNKANAGLTATDVGALPITGGTLTGNLQGKYITGTWLQGTANNYIGTKQNRVAVFNSAGWLYSRTPEEIVADGGGVTSDKVTNYIKKIQTITIKASQFTVVDDEYQAKITDSSITSGNYVDFNVSKDSYEIATEAQMQGYTMSDTGYFIITCKELPTADITGNYTIVGGD